jgi:hypothetical protein
MAFIARCPRVWKGQTAANLGVRIGGHMVAIPQPSMDSRVLGHEHDLVARRRHQVRVHPARAQDGRRWSRPGGPRMEGGHGWARW